MFNENPNSTKSSGEQLFCSKHQIEFFSTYLKVQQESEDFCPYLRLIEGPMDTHVQVNVDGNGDAKNLQKMIMFGSNNYLNLANNSFIKKDLIENIKLFGHGVGGPPLLNGRTVHHQKLESKLAQLKDKEDALLFSSGFLTNLGWMLALIQDTDVLIVDELCHASVQLGLSLLSRNPKIRILRFRHNDANHLERILKRLSQYQHGRIFVYVEGVYSMDGDLACLDKLAPLVNRYPNGHLIVDDAHGTGVTGPNGKGTAAQFGVSHLCTLIMGTFSKTFASTGGFLAGDKKWIDYLRFHAPSYIFSAHISLSNVFAVLASLKWLDQHPFAPIGLHKNVQYFLKGAKEIGLNLPNIQSAIVPLLVDKRYCIRKLAKKFHQAKIFVNSVEYPAVSLNGQRIRLSFMNDHTEDNIDHLLTIIEQNKEAFYAQ